MFGQLAIFTTMLVMNVIMSFITVVVSSGWPSIPPAMIVAVVVLACSHLYINAQMPVKRNMSNNRAPILGHLGNVLSGIGAFFVAVSTGTVKLILCLVSVRAYDAQVEFRDESLRRIDLYTRTACSYWNLNRWASHPLFFPVILTPYAGGSASEWMLSEASSAAR